MNTQTIRVIAGFIVAALAGGIAYRGTQGVITPEITAAAVAFVAGIGTYSQAKG